MSKSNADLFARRQAAVPKGVGNATAIIADRALNAEIWDVEGKRYIDFVGGIGSLNTGHRHPKVMKAVHDQLEKVTHSAFQVMAYEPYIELAERLNEIAPVEGPAKTIFFATGAEATENAIKIARVATGRSAVIAFAGGFHDGAGDQRHGFRVVEFQAARAAPFGEQGGGEQQEFVAFAR